jgi:hypothetical protein
MTSDDLRRIFLGPTLFRLDTVVAPRIVPIFYFIGLVGILVWAINQLFYAFGRSFFDGLWGLIEIAVFGLLWLIILRVACEAVLVFFRAHATAAEQVRASRIPATLLEDVRDAIHDLAEDEAAPASPTPPRTPPAPALPQRGPVRRTAKRTPPPAPPAAPATPAVITPPPAPPVAPAAPGSPTLPVPPIDDEP